MRPEPSPDAPVVLRPRILFLSRNLPPLRGGMERLNAHIAEELAREFDIAVCGPAGSAAELPFVSQVREAPLRPLSRFLAGNFRQAIGLAREWQPSLIVCGSGLTVPIALFASRWCGARVVAYLHGLDIVAKHFVYRALWRRALRHIDRALVNSRNTARLAAEAGIPADRIRVLHPGVHLPEVPPAAAAGFRARHDLGDSPILLSVGRLTERKGLAEFIEHAMPVIVAARGDVKLAVIGEEATDALVSKGAHQKQRLLDSAARAGVSPAIRLLGALPDAELSAAFAASSALVFPVLDLPGDVEGFGMVAIEAAAHGVPTVAFAVGGVPDAVSEPDSGVLLRSGDYPAMALALLRLMETPADAAVQARRQAFAAGFAWPCFGERLRRICRETIPVTPERPT